MFEAATIGIDLAKHVFQIDDGDRPRVRRQVRRGQFLAFFEGRSRCLIGMEACAGEIDEFIEANHVLRGLIYAGAHNSVIADAATALRRRLTPFRRAQFRLEGRPPRSHAEHDAVVSAIVRGDAAAAHAAMLHHVTLVEESYEQLCAEAQGASSGRVAARV